MTRSLINIHRTWGPAMLTMSVFVLILYLYFHYSAVSARDYLPSLHFGSKHEHEPEVYSKDDNPEMQFWRKYGHVTSLPSDEEIKTLSEKKLHYIYHSYLDNTDFLCRRKIRMGKQGDGGWEVCDDYEYRPIQPCVVYSFGIRYDFSFDNDVGKLYGCIVHSFDPSMSTNTQQRSEKLFFYKMGLGGPNGEISPFFAPLARQKNWLMKSFSGIKALLKHQQTTIDIVKMDIEHSEWLALPNMLEKGELSHVRQLFVEFHLYKPNATMYRERLPTLAKLQRLGFRRFHTHMNPKCPNLRNVYPEGRSGCYEIYFVNTRFSRPKSMVQAPPKDTEALPAQKKQQVS